MPYSAVTQPRPWPLIQGGRRSRRLAVHNTWVLPHLIRQEPSACSETARSILTGLSSSACRLDGRIFSFMDEVTGECRADDHRPPQCPKHPIPARLSTSTKLVPPGRIELTTSPLPRVRSTTELRRRIDDRNVAPGHQSSPTRQGFDSVRVIVSIRKSRRRQPMASRGRRAAPSWW